MKKHSQTHARSAKKSNFVKRNAPKHDFRKKPNRRNAAATNANETTPEIPTAQPTLRRCNFTTADGRRCTLPQWKSRAFCRSHSIREDESLNPSTSAQELLSLSGEFKTYRDVNRVLGKLWEQVVKGRIARADACTLAYIGQLLLQTLHPVRAEIVSEGGTRAWQQTLHEVFDAVRASQQQNQAQHSSATMSAQSQDGEEDLQDDVEDDVEEHVEDNPDANADDDPDDDAPDDAEYESDQPENVQPNLDQPEVEESVDEIVDQPTASQPIVQPTEVTHNVAAKPLSLELPKSQFRDVVRVPQWDPRPS